MPLKTTPSPVIFPLTVVHFKLNLQCVVWKKEATFCGSIFFPLRPNWLNSSRSTLQHYHQYLRRCANATWATMPQIQNIPKRRLMYNSQNLMPLAWNAPFSFERSVVPCFLYCKSTQPMAQRSPWGLRPSCLSDAAASQKRGKYFLHAALHGKWQRKKVAKLIRGQLSSSPPAASAQKVSVRVMEEVLVLPSCSLNEEGISAWSTTGLSITELTRPRPLGEWNPSLPVWLCSAPAKKANKHAPEFVEAFARRGRRAPRNAESPYVENKMMHEFAIMPCWVHLCVHRGAFSFFFWENSLYFSLNSAFLEDRAVVPVEAHCWKVKCHCRSAPLGVIQQTVSAPKGKSKSSKESFLTFEKSRRTASLKWLL